MSKSVTLKWTVQGVGDEIVTDKTYTGGATYDVDEDIPVGADQELAIAIDVSQVKAIEIVADGALTLESNSTSAPDDTLALVANVPYRWSVDSYDPFKFETDVTVIYVTNASGATRNLKIKGCYDPTPA